MDNQIRNYNRKIAWGCGGIIFVFMLVLIAGIAQVVQQDRQQAQYPGSTKVSQHSNYKGLPQEYRWDDSYRINDDFSDVYYWYSRTFDLGTEQKANGTCILLAGDKSQLMVKRTISVLLCGTANGQMAFVTRHTNFGRP